MYSKIRIRQIDEVELSSFVSGIFSLFPQVSTSGDIIPSSSGVYNLGSASLPYSKVFTNQLNLASGSGINFGNTRFNAYISGGAAYVDVGGILISSSGDFIYIQGPSGAIGPSGAVGPTGVSGIGVTGASYNTNTSILTFGFSNGSSSSFDFQGLSGATGASVTGFYRSGDYIFPQYDNFRGTGAGIQLLAGPAGPPSSINLFFEKFGSEVFDNQTNFPASVVLDSYFSSDASPDISMMRGMAYTFDVSGLNTHAVTAEDILLFESVFSGQTAPFSEGDDINYFTSGDISGYWRMAFFPSNTATGYYEAETSTLPDIFSETTNSEIYGTGVLSNIYRTKLSFITNFSAQNHYKYGFMVYTLGGELAYDEISPSTGYAYVLGNAYISSGVGPAGPQGPTGIQGQQGIQGPIGPKGDDGSGIDVISYYQISNGNESQLQFVFSDGSTGPWVILPTGGPSGQQGPSGAEGSFTNHFRGEYNNSTVYELDDSISFSGSSFIYINASSGSGNLPTNVSYWQTLALRGDVGPTGATGYADRYSASFSVISGFPTGAGTYANNITGITVNNVGLSGTGAKFSTGQIVSFQNSGLIGLAYTPNQSIILSSSSITGSYCYGNVNFYSQANGIISFTVSSGGTGITNSTISGGNFLWYNYGNATINLGANLMSGAQGERGPVGPQGPQGAPSVMRCQNYSITTGDTIILEPTGLNITGGSGIDIFNVMITGDGLTSFGGLSAHIDVNWTYVQTGQSILIKIRNSGVLDGNGEPPAFYFSGVNTINAGLIKWPNGVYTRPDNGQAYFYTILRCPDEFGQFSCYGTYSNPYF